LLEKSVLVKGVPVIDSLFSMLCPLVLRQKIRLGEGIDIFTRFDRAESHSLSRFYAFTKNTFPRDKRQLLSPCWSILWNRVYRQTVVVVFALARRHPRHQEV